MAKMLSTKAKIVVLSESRKQTLHIVWHPHYHMSSGVFPLTIFLLLCSDVLFIFPVKRDARPSSLLCCALCSHEKPNEFPPQQQRTTKKTHNIHRLLDDISFHFVRIHLNVYKHNEVKLSHVQQQRQRRHMKAKSNYFTCSLCVHARHGLMQSEMPWGISGKFFCAAEQIFLLPQTPQCNRGDLRDSPTRNCTNFPQLFQLRFELSHYCCMYGRKIWKKRKHEKFISIIYKLRREITSKWMARICWNSFSPLGLAFICKSLQKASEKITEGKNVVGKHQKERIIRCLHISLITYTTVTILWWWSIAHETWWWW